MSTKRFQKPKAPCPLVVDLDGTLTPGQTLHQALRELVKTRLWQGLLVLACYGRGHNFFKEMLAARSIIPPKRLAYHKGVLTMVRAAKKQGRRVVLCSASHQKQVTAIHTYLQLFDEAYGSQRHRNLSGKGKARFLVKKYGHKNFDYLGDSRRDIPTWRHARKAITVGASPRLRKKVARLCPDLTHLAGETN